MKNWINSWEKALFLNYPGLSIHNYYWLRLFSSSSCFWVREMRSVDCRTSFHRHIVSSNREFFSSSLPLSSSSILAGALTTVSRLIKKTFWVFKIQEFPSGKVLVSSIESFWFVSWLTLVSFEYFSISLAQVFNTTNIFTICQLVFIASLQAMVWVIREQSDQGGNRISSKRFMYSLLLPWIPLVTGAYLSVQVSRI